MRLMRACQAVTFEDIEARKPDEKSHIKYERDRIGLANKSSVSLLGHEAAVIGAGFSEKYRMTVPERTNQSGASHP